jgi:hypothetical protein
MARSQRDRSSRSPSSNSETARQRVPAPELERARAAQQKIAVRATDLAEGEQYDEDSLFARRQVPYFAAPCAYAPLCRGPTKQNRHAATGVRRDCSASRRPGRPHVGNGKQRQHKQRGQRHQGVVHRAGRVGVRRAALCTAQSDSHARSAKVRRLERVQPAPVDNGAEFPRLAPVRFDGLRACTVDG